MQTVADQESPLKNVWMIIPVYNRREITLGCLEHLDKLGVPDWCQIVVTDGGSTDGTVDAVRERFPRVQVLQGRWWWMEGIRAGMEHAQAQGAMTYVWLNDDCRPTPGSVESLVKRARETGHVCGGITRSPYGVYAGMRKTWLGLRPLDLSGLEPGGVLPGDSLVGNFVAWPGKVVTVTGLPDAGRFPHLCADHYYTLEAGRCGFPCELVGGVEAEDVHPDMGWARQSILRGDQPVGFVAKWLLQWNPRAGLLPELRLHRRFWGPAGVLIPLGPWLKKWLLLSLRILLPRAVRTRL
ncbi:glycosyltransferase [Verrucomicrobium sp. BvORR106]|uniref:glycosyltransferase family 2 protein n=1 Tax=Verrucomicrobium sp. BvORR106 TaxID=1403819 RepID=UPI0006910319|nr:glycosyltransferase [Verrucomicrobium sp. BvORR106]